MKQHSFHKAFYAENTRLKLEMTVHGQLRLTDKKTLPQTSFASFTKKIRFLRGLIELSW